MPRLMGGNQLAIAPSESSYLYSSNPLDVCLMSAENSEFPHCEGLGERQGLDWKGMEHSGTASPLED